MNKNNFLIEAINMRDADDTIYVAAADHRNRFRLERDPQTPPLPLAQAIAEWQNVPTFILINHWLVWDAAHTAVIAMAHAVRYAMGDENKHLLQFHISVDMPYRQQGIGRALLGQITAVARAEERRMCIAGAASTIPAAGAFLQRLGGKVALETTVNQLDIAELNHDLMQAWVAKGLQAAERYDLGFWDGIYPEEDMPQIVQLVNVMNQAPHDDLDVEDVVITPERLREMEASDLSGGAERWTAYLRERATGQLVGFTEAVWRPHNPSLLSQGNTGVFPEHRGAGLGQWLKGAMLQRVLAERPEVRYVRTGNANSNAPMLAINHALGFRPYIAESLWQMPLESVTAYLDGQDEEIG